MIQIFISLMLLSLTQVSDLLSTKADFIFSMQSWCFSQIPENAESKALMDSFLCGGNITDAFSRELFLQTGLIHLLVVSGGHFAFLVATLDFFSFQQKDSHKLWPIELLKIPILVGFSFMTGFQAPVVRALISLLIQAVNRRYRWHWDQGKVQLIAGISILVLFPEWIYSLSFYLSWLSSIGLCFAPLWLDTSLKNHSTWSHRTLQWFSTCLLIQCLISLFFWQFSWVSLFFNLLIAPVLMILLWPLCLLQIFIPSASPLLDLSWVSIFRFLKFCLDLCQRLGFSQISATEINFQTLNWIYLWGIIVFAHCVLEIMTRKRFQNSYA